MRRPQEKSKGAGRSCCSLRVFSEAESKQPAKGVLQPRTAAAYLGGQGESCKIFGGGAAELQEAVAAACWSPELASLSMRTSVMPP